MMMKMMMKNLGMSTALGLLILAACTDKNGDGLDVDPGNGSNNSPMATVKFELNTDASNAGAITRGATPVYTKEGFRILAFKQQDAPAGSDFIYAQDVPLDKLNFNESTLSGTVQLPIGIYKFVPMYWNPQSSTAVTVSPLTDQPLSSTLNLTHEPGNALPAIFLQNESVEDYPKYILGTTSTDNDPVKATINRAVSRVDLMFIRADKIGDNVYTEKSGENIFGGKTLKSISMQFTTVPSKVDFSGNKQEGTIDHTYLVDVANAITMGEGASTAVGTNGYTNYDAIEKNDIISGSAHVEGAYLFPNADDTPTTGLEIVVTPETGTARTISITKLLPLVRNHVTLVKVYVLGDNVFTTGVDFEVVIDTVWADSHTVEGEVK